ncbi:unnamed protein product [Adineta ricciae]|uniref:RING-type domain-containing protein n=1 Tax=Adineta ricciae TaxID=249248 RepID=A0A815AT60_ADIRI|nr:unnamed protein product [Adineta ricciae]
MTKSLYANRFKRNDFEYTNESVIDNRLKCSICKEVFQDPVFIKTCRHDFCRTCIVQWLKTNQNCPICRQPCCVNDLNPNQSRIILDMLDDLRLKCRRCNETNIQPSDKEAHLKRCPNVLVKCLASDLQCKWVGKRSELQNHLQTCIFQQLHPVIEQLRTETQLKVEQIKVKLNHTQQSLNNLRLAYVQQKRFISAFINNGKPMTNICTVSSPNSCKIMVNSGILHQASHSCAVCEQMVNFDAIALHNCMGGIICRRCVHKYSRQDQKNQLNIQNRSRSLSRPVHRTDNSTQNVVITNIFPIASRRTFS